MGLGMKLRVHHLLCSALYRGKGYSEAFCENMERTVNWLWRNGPEQPQPQKGASSSVACAEDERIVELCICPDAICQACPNLADGACTLDDNRVVPKDARLAEALHLQTGRTYLVQELLLHVKENLTEEIFEASCRKCEWYQQKLCSYKELAKRYDGFL